MVGGIKRADGTARPASDLTASKEMSTSDRTAKDSGHDAPPSNDNTNAQDISTTGRERIESPDWPSDIEGDDDDGEEDGLEDRTVGRGREKVPSRSPPPEGNGEVWHDPLDEDEDGDQEGGPPAKRSRPD